jgi:hypothetical protein
MKLSGDLRGTRALKWNLLGLALILLALPVSGQSDARQMPQRTERYERGAGDNEITEAAFRLTGLDPKQRERVSIRVCSKEPIVRAMANAPANPFQIADKFVNGYAYLPEKVLFLRAEDCLSAGKPSITPTEIWAIPEGASLPQHVDVLKSNQIKLVSLGKRPLNRGVRDYKAALRELIENLRGNPHNIGMVFGYFLEHPSLALRGRIREVTRILKLSGLPRERYLVRLTYWPDEVSTYPPDSEPQYPSLFVVEVASAAKQK